MSNYALPGNIMNDRLKFTAQVCSGLIAWSDKLYESVQYCFISKHDLWIK